MAEVPARNRAPGIVARAHRLVTTFRFAAAALDAPGHGDRPKTVKDEQLAAGIRSRVAAGEPIGAYVARDQAERAEQAVPEWQAAVDALQELDCIGGGSPVGFWGVSLGSVIGVPLVAHDSRIAAAVFGLVGAETLRESASRVSVPIQFLLQWEVQISRESGLALFDAFGSTEKTLHANMGGHMGIPAFELESAASFFARHLVERPA